MMNLDPGWLEKTVRRAARKLHARFLPMELIHHRRALGIDQPVTIPLGESDTRDLYEDLSAHFYAWTGRSLKDYRP